MDTGLLQGFDLALAGAFAAGDDGAGVAHAFTGGGGDAGDIADDGFGDVGLDVFGGFLFGTAANFADHDDAFGGFIVFKAGQDVDKIHAFDGVAANADAGGLAESGAGGLVDRFVGEGAGAGDNTDGAGLVDKAGHNSDFAFAGGDDAGAVGADQEGIVPGQGCLGFEHVEYGYAFGNADDEFDAGIGRFEDGINGKGWRDVDHAGGGAGGFDGIPDGVVHREVEVSLVAPAWGDAANQLGAVGKALFGVKSGLFAGEALTDDFGVFIDQYAHLAASTAFLAASSRSVAVTTASPDSSSSRKPSAALVPSSRTMTGMLTPTSLQAVIMPSAIRLHLTMPPNMLTSSAFTL